MSWHIVSAAFAASSISQFVITATGSIASIIAVGERHLLDHEHQYVRRWLEHPRIINISLWSGMAAGESAY
jgi:hypothetical protein